MNVLATPTDHPRFKASSTKSLRDTPSEHATSTAHVSVLYFVLPILWNELALAG